MQLMEAVWFEAIDSSAIFFQVGIKRLKFPLEAIEPLVPLPRIKFYGEKSS